MLKKAVWAGLAIVLVLGLVLAPLAVAAAGAVGPSGGQGIAAGLGTLFKAAGPAPIAIACHDGGSSGGSCGGG